MTEKEEQNLNEILQMISDYKSKKILRLKVFQCDYSNGHPSHVYLREGCSENGDVHKSLVKLGYTVKFEHTDKQITSNVIKKKIVNKLKKLSTTNMVIEWR